jgi:hypothetical protein
MQTNPGYLIKEFPFRDGTPGAGKIISTFDGDKTNTAIAQGK